MRKYGSIGNLIALNIMYHLGAPIRKAVAMFSDGLAGDFTDVPNARASCKYRRGNKRKISVRKH